MKLQLKRPQDLSKFPNYTISKLYIDREDTKGWIPFCDVLEDIVRDKNKNGKFDNGEIKIYGETAIPYGIYGIVITFSPHFGKELPLLLNVPNFEGIRIHGGNSKSDTYGCLLVGINTEIGKVTQSQVMLKKLMNEFEISNQDKWIIEII